MKKVWFLAVLVLLLFAFGCAGPGQAQPPSSSPSPKPSQEAQKNESRESPLPPIPSLPDEEPPAAQQPAVEKCTVLFQKDASSVYYIMVRADSQKKVSVKCPSGNMAEKRGELYFCAPLDGKAPVIAYLDGVECGRAQFGKSGEAPAVGRPSCTVSLGPARITKGERTLITVQTHTPLSEATLAYLCGSEEISEKFSGMVVTGKNCRFDTPGKIEVYAKVNGELCGSANLEVFEKAKECSVSPMELSKNGALHTYAFKVAARGYSGGDTLRYKCYDTSYAIKLESLGVPTSDFVKSFECSSKAGPLSSPIKVYINNDYCGEAALPA
ncbi:MAG: hypothetical protein N3G22_04375 [Candidatus Micrarchaeota archaeon]|nr:hypothetical protein [Candidatus Micrarchaeota archaeon]